MRKLLASLLVLYTLSTGSAATAHHKPDHAGGPSVELPSEPGNNTPDKNMGVQGNSPSAPDQDSKGPDRDNAVDEEDTDGNSGNGNDGDRCDDDEGNNPQCASNPTPRPPRPTPTPSPTPTPTPTVGGPCHRGCGSDVIFGPESPPAAVPSAVSVSSPESVAQGGVESAEEVRESVPSDSVFPAQLARTGSREAVLGGLVGLLFGIAAVLLFFARRKDRGYMPFDDHS